MEGKDKKDTNAGIATFWLGKQSLITNDKAANGHDERNHLNAIRATTYIFHTTLHPNLIFFERVTLL